METEPSTLPVPWEFWDSLLQAEPPAAPSTIPGFPATSPNFSSNENPAPVMCAPESLTVPSQGQVEIKRIQESQGTIVTTSWDGQVVPNLISLALLPALSS